MPAGTLPRRIVRDAQFSYMLDCGVELGEITPLEAAVFRADNDASAALSAALDGRQYPDDFMRNSARAYLNGLTRKERLVWALIGLDGMEFALQSLRERMSFVLQKKVQCDLGLDEPIRISWLYELNGGSAEEENLFRSVHDVTPDRAMAYLQPRFERVRSLIKEDLDLAVEAMEWLKQPGARAEARALALQLLHAEHNADQRFDLPSCKAVRGVSKVKKLRNQARGAIKKAVALFTSLGMETSVQMLVSGQTVTLQHQDSALKFEVAPLKTGWLEEKTLVPGGHVPFQLSVLTKEGVFLSRLCVLVKASPVLDQLLALSMFVQTGNEMELLSKANWFGYADAAQARALLAEKAPAVVDKIPDPNRSKSTILARTGSEPSIFCEDLNQITQLRTHWEPFEAPVNMWLKDWLGPAVQSLSLLKDSGPVLSLT